MKTVDEYIKMLEPADRANLLYIANENYGKINGCLLVDLSRMIRKIKEDVLSESQNWTSAEEPPKDSKTVITIRKTIKGRTYHHLNSYSGGKWSIGIPDTSEITHWKYI